MAGEIKALALPFKESIDFFRAKTNIPTDKWTDVWQGQHARGFMVAGAMKADLLGDLREAVDASIADGESHAEFVAKFRETVKKHGWEHTGGTLWRAKVIRQTNLQQSNNAGRWIQGTNPKALKHRPYVRYRHGGSAEPRQLHLSWDGTVVPHDHPWLQTHSPSNDWGCTCDLEFIGPRDLKKMGKDKPDDPKPGADGYHTVDGPDGEPVRLPNGVGLGFDYGPDLDWGKGITPASLKTPWKPIVEDKAKDSAPTPRNAPAKSLKGSGKGFSDAFLNEFKAKKGAALVQDVTGARVAISPEMMAGVKGTARNGKMVAEALRDPDEVFLQWHRRPSGAYELFRVYLRQFDVPGAGNMGAVFKYSARGWEYQAGMGLDVNAHRFGGRLYKRV